MRLAQRFAWPGFGALRNQAFFVRQTWRNFYEVQILPRFWWWELVAKGNCVAARRGGEEGGADVGLDEQKPDTRPARHSSSLAGRYLPMILVGLRLMSKCGILAVLLHKKFS
jgi:hypothetical protein